MARLKHMLWLLVALLTGCSAMDPKDFAGTEPKFELFEYFSGETRAWGIFQDRGGRLKRQFVVDIHGEMQDGELVLTEDFAYADGERSQRIWRIRKLDEHRYEGRAADVVGVAEGLAYGSTLNWRYTLQIPYAGRTLEVNFDDWMFLQSGEVLINRAKLSKFGFRVGEVTLVFSKGD